MLSFRLGFHLLLTLFLTLGASAVLGSRAAMAQSQAPNENAQTRLEGDQRASLDDEILVVGTTAGELSLGSESETGSRLGLTLLDTPASVDIINAETMAVRGHSSVSAAVETLPGVVSGESPAAPSTFSLRGFTRSQITVLRDGIWIGPTNMVMRPQNTFNLDRIELLRGTASALYGQGAVGGVINVVTKQAQNRAGRPVDLTASIGRFQSVDLGVGTQLELSDRAWLRVDAAHGRSDGYVEGMDPRSTNLTSSLLFSQRDNLKVRLSLDYLDDQLANYWGTPLTPRSFTGANEQRGVVSTQTGETIDRRVLRTNFNVSDGVAESDQLLARVDIDWQGTNLGLKSSVYSFGADRDWANAEGFVFNQATEKVDRTNGFFFVTHDQQLLGNRSQLSHRSQLGDRENRLVVGLEIADLDFERSRGFRFSPRPGDSVDFLSPEVGSYGPRELRGVSPTDIDTRALFVENLLEVTDAFSIVVGARAEWLDLVRENYGRTGNFEDGSSFARNFNHVNWKVGAVYQPASSVSIFGQYGSATDPVNANIFLVNAGEDFDLTDAKQWELGLKGRWLNDRVQSTLTFYDITRDDVLDQIGVDSASLVGGRDASGVELATSISAERGLRFGFNASYTDAAFKRSANFNNNAGNQPPNVPQVVLNLFGQVSDIAGLPFDAGIDVRYVDDRFGDNANTVTLHSYTLTGLFMRYRWGATQLIARASNLTEEVYSPWADVFYLQQTDPSFPYANQILVGAPRTFELSLRTRF